MTGRRIGEPHPQAGYHPVWGRRHRDPNPYTLREIINADPTGEGGEFPGQGDYLWFPNQGTALITDVLDASAVDVFVRWQGMMCQGPVGDGLSWGHEPHQWIAVEGTIEPDEEFKILRVADWPRLPVTGDVVNITAHPPFRLLHVAEHDGPRETATEHEGYTHWAIGGPTTTFHGDPVGEAHLSLWLHTRTWDLGRSPIQDGARPAGWGPGHAT